MWRPGRASCSTKDGAPLAARDVGGGVEERGRVHPHREAGLDEQLRGGQPHHSGAEHRDLSQRGPGVLADQIADLDGAAPAHRDARAAVAVVVDDEFRSAPRLSEDSVFPAGRWSAGTGESRRGTGNPPVCSRSSDRVENGLPGPATWNPPCDLARDITPERLRFAGTSD